VVWYIEDLKGPEVIIRSDKGEKLRIKFNIKGYLPKTPEDVLRCLRERFPGLEFELGEKWKR